MELPAFIQNIIEYPDSHLRIKKFLITQYKQDSNQTQQKSPEANLITFLWKLLPTCIARRKKIYQVIKDQKPETPTRVSSVRCTTIGKAVRADLPIHWAPASAPAPALAPAIRTHVQNYSYQQLTPPISKNTKPPPIPHQPLPPACPHYNHTLMIIH